jgi:hypothetical protein
VPVVARLAKLVDDRVREGNRFTIREMIDADEKIKQLADEATLSHEALHLQAINVTNRECYESKLFKAVHRGPAHRVMRENGNRGIYLYPAENETTRSLITPKEHVLLPWRWNKQQIAGYFEQKARERDERWEKVQEVNRDVPSVPRDDATSVEKRATVETVEQVVPAVPGTTALLHANRALIETLRHALDALAATTSALQSFVEPDSRETR